MTALYVPPTDESDHKKQNMSLQLLGSAITTNTAAIAALPATFVSSIAGNNGAFTLNSTSGITNSTNDILLSQASSSQFGAVKVDGTTITASSGVISATTGPAWTTYTGTVTASAGTFTTVSGTGAYYANGKTVIFNLVIGITTVGTASGSITCTLPIGTAKRVAVLTALLTNTGEMAYGSIAASATTITGIVKYNGTTVIGAGNIINLSGVYEQT